jgi:hypothetical protein
MMKHKQGELGDKMPPKNELSAIHVQETDSNTEKSESC